MRKSMWVGPWGSHGCFCLGSLKTIRFVMAKKWVMDMVKSRLFTSNWRSQVLNLASHDFFPRPKKLSLMNPVYRLWLRYISRHIAYGVSPHYLKIYFSLVQIPVFRQIPGYISFWSCLLLLFHVLSSLPSLFVGFHVTSSTALCGQEVQAALACGFPVCRFHLDATSARIVQWLWTGQG